MSQRTRSNGAVSSSGVTSYYLQISNPNAVAINVSGYNVPAGGSTLLNAGGAIQGQTGNPSTITDYVPGIGSYNPVDHVQSRYDWPIQSIDRTYQCTTGGSPSRPYSVRIYGNIVPSLDGYYLQDGFFPSTDSIAVLLGRATNQIRPGEPPMGFDLAQFIGELTDFSHFYKGLANHLLARRSKLVDLLYGALTKKGWRRIGVNPDSLTLANLVKYGVSADLARKLVWNPLYKDLGKLRKALMNMQNAYAATLKPQTLVCRGSGTGTSTSMEVATSTSAGYLTYSIQRSRSRKVTAWVRVIRKPLAIPDGQRWFGHYFGLYPRTSVAWELMPLSFVIDWFADVGSWLRQFESGPISLPFDILQSGYSVLEETSIGHTAAPNWPTAINNAVPPSVRGSYTKRSFRRYTGGLVWNASTLEPLKVQLPNLGQLGTLAELVYAAWRRNDR